ncbi:MAG: TRAP transporter small permease [Chloroflexi bacterium]|nr:TRAP transporter small permease [Chloroflexota bacterium]
MARGLYYLGLAPRIGIIFLLVVLLVDMMLGVIFRYIVGQALSWTEEVGTLSLVWLTFVGGAVGIRRGAHFSIHLLVDHLSEGQQRALHILNAILIMIIGLILVPTGWKLMMTNSTSETPALGLSLSFVYASSLVGGLLMICYAAGLALDAYHGRQASEHG